MQIGFQPIPMVHTLMIYRLGVKSNDAEVDDHGVDSAHANPRVWLDRVHEVLG